MGSARGRTEVGEPSMKVKVPLVAPTTPPDIGESMKVPWVGGTRAATEREVEGSIVEVSIRRRFAFGVRVGRMVV